MSQGYPSFPSWDEAQPVEYAPPPAVAYPGPPAARPSAPPAAPASMPYAAPYPAPPAPSFFAQPAVGSSVPTVITEIPMAPAFGRAAPPPAGYPDFDYATGIDYAAGPVAPPVARKVPRAAIYGIVATALLAAGVLGYANLHSRPAASRPAAATPTPRASAFEAPPFPVDPTGPAVPTFPGASKGAPAGLRADAPARQVAGATFGRDEDVSVATSGGWPFAFRIPADWKCVGGKVDLPDSEAMVCFDKRTEKNERAGIILRTCPSTCDAADRAKLDQQWFENTAGLRRADGDTRFRQTAENGAGKYQLELGHFFTDPASGVKYQVGVDARTAPAQKAKAQKVVNDVLSQTTF
ncbi:hypothetical protein [Actinoplanes sp. HUAS TT8]|uniref:hypothetical protein n=1 Tax=Actinoplanes sp. HUAS TT8 TaxID=3447453 RepID=UPI003F51E0C2